MQDAEDFSKVSPSDMKALLERSGYLFEQEVGSRIEKLGFQVETNKAFLDGDEGKSREMDVYAHKMLDNNNKSLLVYCYLNCECKNSSNPYVFITRKKGLLDKFYIPDGIYLPKQELNIYVNDERKSMRIVPSFTILELKEHHFVCKADHKAVQICKLVRKGKDLEMQHSGVIEGFIYPLVKSKEAFVKLFPMPTDYISSHVIFNLAVVKSKLFTVNSEKKDSLPIEVPYVPLVRDIQTSTIKGKRLITFVNEEYLEDFIKNELDAFFKAVEEALLKKLPVFKGKAMQGFTQEEVGITL